MNKTELVDAVVSKTEISKNDATSAVDAVFDIITNTLSNKDTVSLVGFGVFSTTDRTARTGRNPRTGETIQIPATTVPKFKAGKGLKESVNNK